MSECIQSPTLESLKDLLHDLYHDLGKYLTLSLRFITEDADDDDFILAVRTGLRETIESNGKPIPATEIWAEFQQNIVQYLDTPQFPNEEYQHLCRVVEKALTWDINANQLLDHRVQARKDLFAVPETIRMMMRML